MFESKDSKQSFFNIFSSIILQRALMCGIFFTDTYFLSLTSDEAVSGVGTAVIFLVSLLSMISVVAMVGVSFLSIAAGEKSDCKFMTISGVLIWLSIAIAFIFTLLQYFLSFNISNWVGLTSKASEAFLSYLFYMLPICIIDAFYSNFSSILLAKKNSKSISYSSAVLFMSNIVFNLIILLGLIPEVELSPKTLAKATIISQFPAILVLIYHLKKEEHFLLDYFKIKKEAKKESLVILKRVLPLSLEPISFNLKDMFIIAFIGNISSIAIASFTYSKNILILLTTVLAGALGVTVQIFSSYSIGKENYPKADSYIKKSLNYYIPIVFFSILIVYLFADLVFSIFTFNEEVLFFIGIIIPYFLFSETFQSVSLIISPTLRGVGDPKLISMFSISSNWILGVLSSFIFAFYFNMGLSGILLGIFLDDVFRAGCNYVLWKKWVNSKRIKQLSN